VGAPYKVLTNESPSGRALYEGLEMQIGVPGGSLRADEQAQALRKLGAQLQRQRKGFKAPPIGVLETEIRRFVLAQRLPGAFALSGASLRELCFPSDQDVFLVAGPMRSGKTTTLLAIAEAMHELDPERQLFFCTGRRSALASASFFTAATSNVEESAALIRQIAEDLAQIETASPPVIFIDDFHETNEGDLGKEVSALLKVAREFPAVIVASGDSLQTRRASQYTPLGELKQFKCGLLLAPEVANSDGDILGATLPNTSVKSWPEGQGYLVERGAIELVQVGLPS
jgi:ATPase family associated with various cellular activities (AAA)